MHMCMFMFMSFMCNIVYVYMYDNICVRVCTLLQNIDCRYGHCHTDITNITDADTV